MNQEWHDYFEEITREQSHDKLPETLKVQYFEWCKNFNGRHRPSSTTSSVAQGTSLHRAVEPQLAVRNPEHNLAVSSAHYYHHHQQQQQQQRPASETRFPSISQSSQGHVDPDLIEKLAETLSGPYESYKQQQAAEQARSAMLVKQQQQQAAEQARSAMLVEQQQQQAAEQARSAMLVEQQLRNQHQQRNANTANFSHPLNNLFADDVDDSNNNKNDDGFFNDKHNRSIEYDNDVKKELRQLRSQFANELMDYGEHENRYRAAAREAEKHRAELAASSVRLIQLQNQIEQQEPGGDGHMQNGAWEGQRRQRRRGHGGGQDSNGAMAK
ncbi:hypothetical protein CTA1_962 [Colletotrichum tanaceti]|uniref:Uncharacterized protein n=1 Tax=Colletotrichum tanaceti TaxID=1306861 RepID=A0A4U6XIJ8_9PEZI|nr:hypothetical protein CTA1_962 [Colletotrichum tanaceti]